MFSITVAVLFVIKLCYLLYSFLSFRWYIEIISPVYQSFDIPSDALIT